MGIIGGQAANVKNVTLGVKRMYNQIIPNLFVGDIEDSILFNRHKPEGVIFCVLEHRPPHEPMKAYHIPIKTLSDHVHTEQLDHIAFMLEGLLEKKCDVLVHCAAGIERSPLTVAYYISYSKGISIHEAYKIVRRNRPQAQDRSMWLIHD